MRSKLIIGLVLVSCMITVLSAAAQETAPAEPPQNEEVGPTPARLSFVDGQVSFWRPGAQDWAQAQLNTALAPGDQLYTGSPGNLELQTGPRAYVRAWANTQIGVESQEGDFLQFKVTAGHVSFDLRSLEPGHTVEVDTPNAAFTIDQAGYYRVDVSAEQTSFIIRRAGRASVTPASGEAFSIAPSEEVVIEGTQSPKVTSYAAPPPDSWDTWNYARTEHLQEAVSARYVSPGVYGVSDLDRSGVWRTVPEYGPVWVPSAVPAGWAPYTTGSWTLDPYYGWTWVDTAPWGWAPYHYGRWVYVGGYWGWAPGPAVARPAYSPALVAFFGHGGASVGVGIGGPAVGWVALGWGEPCVPWWGRPGFAHRPWWGGWGGPHVVNNVVVSRTTVVKVENINVYHNAGVRNGLVVVKEDRFGHGPITSARISHVEVQQFHPIHQAPRVAAGPASFAPSAKRGVRPPEASLRRPVVATRPPQAAQGHGRSSRAEPRPGPAHRFGARGRERLPPLCHGQSFGQSGLERSTTNRAKSPAPPKPGLSARPGRSPEAAPSASRPVQRQPQGQVAGPSSAAPRMPGEPASRLSPKRGEARSPQTSERKPPEAKSPQTSERKPPEAKSPQTSERKPPEAKSPQTSESKPPTAGQSKQSPQKVTRERPVE